MGQWFIDDEEYLRLWAWLARAPVEEDDARCPAFDLPLTSGGRGRAPAHEAGSARSDAFDGPLGRGLRGLDYRLVP